MFYIFILFYFNILFLGHKGQNEGELLSINLRDPLAMEIPEKTRNSLLRRKVLLKKYGINLGSLRENTKLLIRTIPQCLVTSNDRCSSEKILSKIYDLLNDILKDNTNRANTLPVTIHNAIASEACHGTHQINNFAKFLLIPVINITRFQNNIKSIYYL